MNDFLISGAVIWTAGGDLSFSSSGKEVLYFFVSWVASALEMAMMTSADNLLGEKESQPKPELEDSSDILLGEGGKVLVEEVDKGKEECIDIVKTDRMNTMSEY